VQRIELLESTAKRGVALIERGQCKRNQYLLGQYKNQLAIVYGTKAICVDIGGRHQDAMKILRDNLPTIQESLKSGGSKSGLYSIFTAYATVLRATGRPDDAQEVESLVKDTPAENASKD